MSMYNNPIIVAIDTPDKARAKALCDTLNGHVGAVKLGLEFFSAHGPAGVRDVLPEGLPLFLDLKFHDIPNTVSKAIRALKGLPIHLLTIHTSGGASMMKAAAEAADWLGGQGGARPKVLGVTVLTSLDALDMEQIGVERDVGQQVEKLALLAKASGLDGIVCSPHEVVRLRAVLDHLPLASASSSTPPASSSSSTPPACGSSHTTPPVYGGGEGGAPDIVRAGEASVSMPPLTSPPQAGGINNQMLLVVPGIRPAQKTPSADGVSPERASCENQQIFAGAIKNDDQKRVMTPKEALAAGADYLVIGRPITEAENPLEVVRAL